MLKQLTGAAKAREERAVGQLQLLPKISSGQASSAAGRWNKVRKNLDLIHGDGILQDVENNSRTEKALRHLFQLIDADGGGTISVMEFASSLRLIGKKLGPRFAYEKPMQLFAQLDQDQSGDIATTITFLHIKSWCFIFNFLGVSVGKFINM